MSMVRLRKDQAGDAAGRLADGTGWSFEWPQDGAVIEVPYEVALDLLAIPHGGYGVADDAESAAGEDESPGEHADSEDASEIEEPAPTEDEFSEAPTPRKRAAAKKTAAKAPVEE